MIFRDDPCQGYPTHNQGKFWSTWTSWVDKSKRDQKKKQLQKMQEEHIYFNLLKMKGRSKTYSPNGGLFVIYHGTKKHISNKQTLQTFIQTT